MKHEFRELRIWQEARELNKLVYDLVKDFPKEENYGLSSQMKRASISIASNISEGSSYESNAMFLKYLNVSLGSLCELETQFYLAKDVGYINNSQLKSTIEQTDKIKRMILGFMKKLKSV